MVAPLWISGLVAAVHSPFLLSNNDTIAALNLSAVQQQRDWLRATGVDWVYVAGTTGESLSLTVQERKALAEAWCRETDAKVIVHVGAEAVADAVELAAHAEKIGALGIGAMPPSFFRPASVDALQKTMQAICDAAPRIPCYYYHIPSKTGVEFAVVDLVAAMDSNNVGNFAGVKYTGLYDLKAGGYADAQRVIAYNEGGKYYEVLAGREEMMLESLAIGIAGHVGSQFNFAGDLYGKILADFAEYGLTSDSAPALRAAQLKALHLLDVQTHEAPTGTNAGKRLMTYAGVPVGEARLPFLPFDDDADASLRTALDAFCAQDDANSDLLLCQVTQQKQTMTDTVTVVTRAFSSSSSSSDSASSTSSSSSANAVAPDPPAPPPRLGEYTA